MQIAKRFIIIFLGLLLTLQTIPLVRVDALPTSQYDYHLMMEGGWTQDSSGRWGTSDSYKIAWQTPYVIYFNDSALGEFKNKPNFQNALNDLIEVHQEYNVFEYKITRINGTPTTKYGYMRGYINELTPNTTYTVAKRIARDICEDYVIPGAEALTVEIFDVTTKKAQAVPIVLAYQDDCIILTQNLRKSPVCILEWQKAFEHSTINSSYQYQYQARVTSEICGNGTVIKKKLAPGKYYIYFGDNGDYGESKFTEIDTTTITKTPSVPNLKIEQEALQDGQIRIKAYDTENSNIRLNLLASNGTKCAPNQLASSIKNMDTTYTYAEPNQEIQLTVLRLGGTGPSHITVSNIKTIRLGLREAPPPFELEYAKPNSLKVRPKNGSTQAYSDIMEFSIDDGKTWNSNGLFTGLESGALIAVTARVNPDLNIAKYDNGTTNCLYWYGPTHKDYYRKDYFWTTKVSDTPVLQERTDTTLTFKDTGCKFKINDTIYNTNVITGLKPGTTYKVYKCINTTSAPAYDWSETPLTVTTKYSARPKMTLAIVNVTKNSVRISATGSAGHSKYFRVSGGSWVIGEKPTEATAYYTFTGLNENTNYTFHAQYASNENYMSSEASSITVKTHKKTMDFHNIKIKSMTTDSYSAGITAYLTLTNPPAGVTADDFKIEYSIDAKNWQDGSSFSNLTPDTTYQIYMRTKENANYEAGGIGFANVTTLKASSTPVLNRLENNKITVNKITGYKYRINEGEWQDSNVFSGLKSGTTYKIYQKSNQAGYGSSSPLTLTTKANATPAAPRAPVVKTIANNKIVMQENTSLEFSLDKSKWQSLPTFTSLKPNTTYTIYARIKETALAGFSDISEPTTITTKKNTNTKIPAAPVVLLSETITENNTPKGIIKVQAVDGVEFSVDEKYWQTHEKDSTFVEFKDLTPGKTYTIYARYIEDDTTYHSDKSDGKKVTLEKGTMPKPSIPAIKSKTDKKIELVAVAGCQYKRDTQNWQDSPVFDNLDPATSYCFYQRYKESDVSFASQDSDVLVATTDKSTRETPNAPIITNVTSNSITVEKIDGMEYCIDSGSWQDSNVFTGLQPNTKYYICQRYKETDKTYASGTSPVSVPSTDKATPNPPTAMPQATTITATSLTFTEYHTYQYSLDNKNWQDSSTFYDLKPNTTYTLYIRLKETQNTYPSNPVQALSVQTIKHTISPPSVPYLQSLTHDTIILQAEEGYQYSKDGTTWQDSNEFRNLSPNTTYTFYQRYKETDTTYASKESLPMRATTNKRPTSPPSIPRVNKVTESSITIYKIPGAMYKIDNGEWQYSNVFEDLAPNTTHSIVAKYEETETASESDASEILQVTTHRKKFTGKVVDPIILKVTATAVILAAVDGYEYCIDGQEWQSSPEFTNLTTNQPYNFLQRFAENDTTYCSEVSGYASAIPRKVKYTNVQKPILVSKTGTSITVQATNNCMYSLDQKNWQHEAVFNNLKEGTTYKIYQKYLEDTDFLESDVSEPLTVKTKAKSFIPILAQLTDTSAKFNVPAGFKIKIEGKTEYKTDGIFEGLTPDTNYKFVQIGDENEYIESSIVIKTKKYPVPNAPTQAIVLGFTSKEIRIKTEKNTEYSLDKKEWGSGSLFKDLTPNTRYTIYARIKETDDTPASLASECSIKTLANFTYGDINNDGKINAKDVLLLRKYLASAGDVNILLADANCDTVVDMKDVLEIRKVIEKKL